MLGLGVELQRRGRSCTLLGTESFRAATVAAGIPFFSIQDRETERAGLDDAGAWTYGGERRRHIPTRCIEPLRRTYVAIVARHRPGRTVVVATSWCLAARLAQEKHGIPTATLHHNAFTLRSSRDVLRMPRPMLVGPWVPPPLVAAQYQIVDQLFIDPLCAPALNALRRELGLPPVRRVMHRWWNSPDAVIGLFPAWWARPQRDWPPQTTLVGFPVFDRRDAAPAEEATTQFLAAGEPVIVFTPGESNLHTREYFEAATEACRRFGRRGLLITSRTEALPLPLAAHMHHARYAPFSQLLAHAAAVVHQAGIGTTAACLRAGVPQVCIPGIYNQPETAERLRRFGVAQMIWPRQVSAERLVRALRELLDDPQVADRCRELAKHFGDPAEATQRACDVVERLFISRTSPT